MQSHAEFHHGADSAAEETVADDVAAALQGERTLQHIDDIPVVEGELDIQPFRSGFFEGSEVDET